MKNIINHKLKILSLIFSVFVFQNCIIHHLSSDIITQNSKSNQQIPRLFVSTEKVQKEVIAINQKTKSTQETFKQNSEHIDYFMEEIGRSLYWKEDKDSNLKIRITGYVPDESNSTLSGFLFLISLGIIPIYFDKENIFKLEIFESDQIILSKKYAIQHKALMGWISIPLNIIISPFSESIYSLFDITYLDDEVFYKISKPILEQMIIDSKEVLQNKF